MQIAYWVLIVSLIFLGVELFRQVHKHASSDKTEHKVRRFLDEHLEIHSSKKLAKSNKQPKAKPRARG
jgi:hypothetical protein